MAFVGVGNFSLIYCSPLAPGSHAVSLAQEHTSGLNPVHSIQLQSLGPSALLVCPNVPLSEAVLNPVTLEAHCSEMHVNETPEDDVDVVDLPEELEEEELEEEELEEEELEEEELEDDEHFKVPQPVWQSFSSLGMST